MSADVEVELDIFSGLPNPTWLLTNAQADGFVKQLSALPPTSAKEPSGNLGYRGFVVHVTQAADTQVARIQKGTVYLPRGGAYVCASDEDRKLERWLLETGRPHLEDEIFHLAERESR
ncbi:MAG: hypothetical protein NVS4B13_02560 [Candidatus Elarobacter sp.]